MKNLYTLLFTLLAGVCNAQYCGNSSPSVCIPVSDTAAQPGIRPDDYHLAPLVNGVTNEVVLQFKNFTSFNFGGQTVTVQSLRFDTIYGLPAGLCWATNKPNNTFGTGEEGCIRFNGNICSAPGQYRVKILVTADIGVPVIDQGDGLEYFIRVKNVGDADTPVDTNQTAQNPFMAYGNAAAGCVSNVVNLTDYRVLVFPNPSNSLFAIQLPELSDGLLFTLKDTFGKLVKQEAVTSKTTTMQREGLPNGIYFWQVVSNEKVLSKGKLILR